MPTVLTILAFCLVFALFTIAMTNELRAFYDKARRSYAASRARLTRPNW